MPESNPPPLSDELRPADRDLLKVMRAGDAVGVDAMIEALGVTATAVRQRLQRLLDLGLIDREKIVAGRGRPTYRYRLTVLGHRRAGANASDLVDAMWREIMQLEDAELRSSLISAIASRLGRQFAAQLNNHGSPEDKTETDSFADRMRQLSTLLTDRHIATEVSLSGDLPVLDIGCCPYPTLTDTSDDRVMCRLEEQMFSEALGQPVQLSSCRLDGDACCKFSPAEKDAVVSHP